MANYKEIAERVNYALPMEDVILYLLNGEKVKGGRDTFEIPNVQGKGHITPASKMRNGIARFIIDQTGESFTNLDLVVYARSRRKVKGLPFAKQGELEGPDQTLIREALSDLIQQLDGVSLQDAMGNKAPQKKTPDLTLLRRAVLNQPIERVLTEVPFTPSDKSLYLEERGISPQVYNSDKFKGLVGSALEVKEKIGYRTEDSQFPPTYFKYINRGGKIVSKEFKNYYTEQALEKLRREEPNEKRSFHRHIGSRVDSLFVSNMPDNPTHLVIIESPLDCLSHYQLHRNKPGFEYLEQAVYVATGGSLSLEQIPIINDLLIKSDIREIILANDLDENGRAFNLSLAGMVSKTGNNALFFANQNKTNGTTIEYKGSDFVVFEQFISNVRSSQMEGDVIIDKVNKTVNYLYSDKNYAIMFELIKQSRGNAAGLGLESVFAVTPGNYKDWNDLLNGKNEVATVLPLGTIPLAKWLDKKQGCTITSKINLTTITLVDEGLVTGIEDYIQVHTGGKYVGNLNMTSLEFEAFSGFSREINSVDNPEFYKDLRKVAAFYSSPIKAEKLTGFLLGGLSVDINGFIIKNGKHFCRFSEHGKIELLNFDTEISESMESALSIMQALRDGGVSPNLTLQLHQNQSTGANNLLYFKGKHAFTISASNKIVPTPYGSHLLETKIGKALTLMVDKIQKVLPEREIPTSTQRIPIQIIGDYFLVGGKKIAFLEEGKVQMTQEGLALNLTQKVYDELQKIQDVGKAAYKEASNYDKRVRINTLGEILVDGMKVGEGVFNEASREVKVILNENPQNKETIETLKNAGISGEIVFVQKGEDLIHSKQLTDIAKGVDNERPVVKLSKIEDDIFFGDMKIGDWSQEENRVKLLAHLGKPSEKFQALIEEFEKNHKYLVQTNLFAKAIEELTHSVTFAALNNESGLPVKEFVVDLDKVASLDGFYNQVNTNLANIFNDYNNTQTISGTFIIVKTQGLIEGLAGSQSISDVYTAYLRSTGKIGKETLTDIEILETLKPHHKKGIGFIPGTILYSGLENDPKWKGVIVGDKVYGFTKTNDGLKPVFALENLSTEYEGFIRSNLPREMAFNKTCILAQDPESLLAHYQINRKEMAFDERVTHYAVSGEENIKAAVFSSALLMPDTLILIGDQEFNNKVKQLDSSLCDTRKYVELNAEEIIKSARISAEELREGDSLLKNLHQKILTLAQPPTGMVINPVTNELTLPSYSLVEGKLLAVGGITLDGSKQQGVWLSNPHPENYVSDLIIGGSAQQVVQVFADHAKRDRTVFAACDSEASQIELIAKFVDRYQVENIHVVNQHEVATFSTLLRRDVDLFSDIPKELPIYHKQEFTEDKILTPAF
jgi:hypothetical protein